jgi:hypothetical protein
MEVNAVFCENGTKRALGEEMQLQMLKSVSTNCQRAING